MDAAGATQRPETPPAVITASDLDVLGTGVAVLGSGGGGRVGHLLLWLHQFDDALRVRLLPADGALDPATRLAVVGYIGSTTVMDEKPPHGGELPAAVAAVERWTDRRADAVMTAQIGGMTVLGALALAHDLDRPLLDADLVGRATPRLDQLVVFAAAPRPLTAAVVTSNGLRTVVETAAPAELESVLRGVVSHAGGWAGFAIGPLRWGDVRGAVVAGSVSRALATGRLLSGCPRARLAELAARLGGRVAAQGRVLDVERHDDRVTFVHGSVALLDPATGVVCRLETGSEYLLLLVDGEPVASVPSIIAVLDARTLAPIPTDDVRPGMDVVVLVLPAAPFWRSTGGRTDLASPRAYGIDADPVPEPAP